MPIQMVMCVEEHDIQSLQSVDHMMIKVKYFLFAFNTTCLLTFRFNIMQQAGGVRVFFNTLKESLTMIGKVSDVPSPHGGATIPTRKWFSFTSNSNQDHVFVVGVLLRRVTEVGGGSNILEGRFTIQHLR